MSGEYDIVFVGEGEVEKVDETELYVAPCEVEAHIAHFWQFLEVQVHEIAVCAEIGRFLSQRSLLSFRNWSWGTECTDLMRSTGKDFSS